MRKNKTLLAAVAVASALAAASAGAVDQNMSRTYDSGDRGIPMPSSVEQTTQYEPRVPGGQPAIPRTNNPMNPNESRPFVQQPEGVRPLVRGDNPNLPNPQTPSAANESSPRPLNEPTNTTGMERAPVGATR